MTHPIATTAIRKAKYGDGSKPWYLVNPKIAGKWMCIPLKMVLIGIDPSPYKLLNMDENAGNGTRSL